MIKFEEFPGSKKVKHEVNLNVITLVSIFVILVLIILIGVFLDKKYAYNKTNNTQNVIYITDN